MFSIENTLNAKIPMWKGRAPSIDWEHTSQKHSEINYIEFLFIKKQNIYFNFRTIKF